MLTLLLKRTPLALVICLCSFDDSSASERSERSMDEDMLTELLMDSFVVEVDLLRVSWMCWRIAGRISCLRRLLFGERAR